MKRILFMVSCLLLIGSTAFATNFGPASPGVAPGQMAFGAGYFHYNGDWDDDTDGRQSMPYVQLSYGLTQGWEIYGQVGAADLSVDDAYGPGDDFEDGYRPFVAAGLKMLITERPTFNLGAFVQGTYFSDYDDSQGGATLDIESNYEANLGLTFEKEIEGALLYGGPVVFTREGDVSASGTLTGSDTYEEDSNFGGFLGIRWELKDGIIFDLEGQYKTGLSGGADVLFKF